jgi:hypothetical protein
VKLGLILLAFGLSIGVAHAAPPTYANLPTDFARAARAFDQGQIKADGKALAALLSDDYRLVNSQAKTETKAEFVADFTDPAFHLEPFEVTDLTSTVWPGGAVLAGQAHLSGTNAGKPFTQTFRFADIWAKRRGRWVVVFTQVTPIPKS